MKTHMCSLEANDGCESLIQLAVTSEKKPELISDYIGGTASLVNIHTNTPVRYSIEKGPYLSSIILTPPKGKKMVLMSGITDCAEFERIKKIPLRVNGIVQMHFEGENRVCTTDYKIRVPTSK